MGQKVPVALQSLNFCCQVFLVCLVVSNFLCYALTFMKPFIIEENTPCQKKHPRI